MTSSNNKHHYMICKSFYIFHLPILAHVFLSCSPYCFARDTLSHEDRIVDGGETLVSAGERFELGFFTPDGSFSGDERRYVGIWYHKLTSQTVVWVANRGKPLTNSDGVLAIKDGNLEVLDMAGNVYWSALLERSASSNLTVKLMDSGNLVLYNNNELGDQYLWQSFEHPTDTFLPQMKMDKNLNLIAWKDENNPEKGDFTFKVEEEDEKQFILTKKLSIYWRSREPGEMRDAGVTYLLSNFSTEVKPTKSIYSKINTASSLLPTFYDDTRLVITFTGQIQFLKLDKERKTWSLQWSEPRDRCSVFNACGNFGVCNIETIKPCKCLPGFEPSFPQQWDSGDYLGGCTRKTMVCGEDSFLSLKMMKVGLESSLLVNYDTETQCRKECLDNCRCQAYSFEEAKKSSRRGRTSVSGPSCRIWEELTSLQEYENGGRNISVRVALSDLEPNGRTCQPCGTTMIPYPLSTAPDCGDPMYSRFLCDTSSTGWVSFQAPGGEYRVISIDPEKRRFVIDTNFADNCNSRGSVVQLDPFLPFKVTNSCYAEPESETFRYISQVSSMGRAFKLEISWDPPKLEPTCASSANCKGWSHSTCNVAKDGRRRCLCGANFRWNDNTLNCTQEGVIDKPAAEPSRESRQGRRLLIWITLPTVILSIIFVASVVSFTIWRRKATRKQESRNPDNRNRTLHTLDSQRRIKDLIDSGDLMSEDDQKGIDVPFFNLESILEATDDFSGLNKLGQGGYGPVYKGKFPGGEDIAVKRLSTLSGQGLQEFKNEVVLIAKLQHRNLVRLRGFCIKGDEKILLYEYMPNRSLDSFIFDQTRSVLLNWETRFNIIMGIARGLLYLHQDSRLRIIHRDLKTSNILLDEEMNAKISDFGLARIFGGKQTEANTSRVVGTYGYMSPEYALDGSFSIKSDVYSFGVVLVEIISGKKNTGFYQSERRFSLLGFAWRLWTGEKVLELMDEALHESCKEDQFVKCVNVALLCVQDDPSDRPAMSNVVTMLDSESASLPTPKEPAFVTRRGFSSTASSSLPETNTEITLTLQEDRLV